jgi:GNAT superfamily N-acetyltransferase
MRSESFPKIAELPRNRLKANDAILIREIALTDAQFAARLSTELGYPAEIDIVRQRIAILRRSRHRVVYVACISNTVIGWIEVYIAHHLSTGSHGEIGGLVVSSEHRSRGVGRKLIAQAERWVADQGIATMVVRSRISREAAHRFYLREGYSMIKTSAVFSKQLELQA